MSPMPYYLEKGPMFSVIEDYVNSNTEHARKMLEALRIEDEADPNYTPLWELPPFGSTNLASKPGDPYWQDFRNKWLGLGPTDEPQSMWVDYEGDVEGITRCSMRTALEVALGVDADAPVPVAPPRHWPIDLYWKCGQSWFEGWVTYRRFGDQSKAGHVVLVFATPSDGSYVVERPADSTSLNKGAHFAVNPTSTRDADGVEHVAGMRVITHRHNRATSKGGIQVKPVDEPFSVILNPTVYVGDEKLGLVTVSPAEADGGVLADPRPYQT